MCASNTTSFYSGDQAGTERVRTTVTAAIDDTCMSMAHGDNESCAGVPLRFAGSEPDSEPGLDHALARYYGSSTGRFLSPDPHSGDVTNPQSMNRYAYALNNPESFIDPMGQDCVSAGDSAIGASATWCDSGGGGSGEYGSGGGAVGGGGAGGGPWQGLELGDWSESGTCGGGGGPANSGGAKVRGRRRTFGSAPTGAVQWGICTKNVWGQTLFCTTSQFGHNVLYSVEAGSAVGLAVGGALFAAEPELSPVVVAVGAETTISTFASYCWGIFWISALSDVVGAPFFYAVDAFQ